MYTIGRAVEGEESSATGRRKMAFWMMLLAVALVSPSAWATGDVDDDVLACLAERKLEPYSPEFFKAIPSCQRELAPIREARAQSLEARQAVWADCMIERIVTMDDGISAAADVANAARDACEPEYAAVVESMGLTAEARARVFERRHSVARDISVGMVLDVRAALDAERGKAQTRTR